MWQFKGNMRPSFAVEPAEGQESVWDYPRPPICLQDSREVIVRCGDVVVAKSTQSIRVLETASPPTFYIPPSDVILKSLTKTSGSSFCEWKGAASAMDQGAINPLTAQGKAFSGDYNPMSISQMEGYSPTHQQNAAINPFSFHFWTRGFPEVIPFGEGLTRGYLVFERTLLRNRHEYKTGR